MKIVQSGKINYLEKQFITNIIKFTIYYNLSLSLQLIIKHHY